MRVFVNGINPIGGRAAIKDVHSLVAVPAIVCADLAVINLFPGILTDVIDVKLVGARSEGEAERIAEAKSINLATGTSPGASRRVAAPPGVGVADKRITRWNIAVALNPQYLALQVGLDACPAATRATVSGANVEQPIRAELEIAGIMISIERKNIIEQDSFGRGQNGVAGRQNKTGYPVDGAGGGPIGWTTVIEL